MKLTAAQEAALRLIDNFSEGPKGGSFMPDRAHMRTFEALARKGVIEWVRVEEGFYNGYRRKA